MKQFTRAFAILTALLPEVGEAGDSCRDIRDRINGLVGRAEIAEVPVVLYHDALEELDLLNQLACEASDSSFSSTTRGRIQERLRSCTGKRRERADRLLLDGFIYAAAAEYEISWRTDRTDEHSRKRVDALFFVRDLAARRFVLRRGLFYSDGTTRASHDLRMRHVLLDRVFWTDDRDELRVDRACTSRIRASGVFGESKQWHNR